MALCLTANGLAVVRRKGAKASNRYDDKIWACSRPHRVPATAAEGRAETVLVYHTGATAFLSHGILSYTTVLLQRHEKEWWRSTGGATCYLLCNALVFMHANWKRKSSIFTSRYGILSHFFFQIFCIVWFFLLQYSSRRVQYIQPDFFNLVWYT